MVKILFFAVIGIDGNFLTYDVIKATLSTMTSPCDHGKPLTKIFFFSHVEEEKVRMNPFDSLKKKFLGPQKKNCVNFFFVSAFFWFVAPPVFLQPWKSTKVNLIKNFLDELHSSSSARMRLPYSGPQACIGNKCHVRD